MLKKVKFICILYFVFQLNGFCFVFTNFNSLNGLSNDNSFQVIQDKDGFMWVATGYGLCKVGPNGIKKYYKSDGLSTNTILSMDIDKNGILWIGTASGLCSLKDGNIQINYSGEVVYRPADLIVEPDFIYWIDQTGGLFSMNRKNDEVASLFPMNDQLTIADGAIRSICRSSDGTIHVAAYNGFYNLNKNVLKKIKIEDLVDTNFFRVFEDLQQNVWITTYDKIYKIKDQQVSDIIEVCNSCYFKINQVYVDKYQKIWYSGMTDRPYSYMLYKGVKYDINEVLNNKSVINHYYSDNNGDIWIATFGKGLFFIKNKPYQYYNSNNGLTSPYTTDVVSTRDKLYIGTNTTFHFFSKSDTLIQPVKLTENKNNTEFIRNISGFGPNFLVSFASQALLPYKCITKKMGEGGDTVYFFNSRYVFGDYELKTAVVDHYDNYLTVYKNISGQFYFSERINKTNLLGNNAHVNSIKRINNKYYICTVRGLMCCNTDLSSPQVLIENKSISDIIVYQNFILVSGEFGILMYSLQTSQLYHLKDFTDKYFLVMKFCVDGYNRLWISTENGIYVYNRGQINHLGPSDGFPSIHITNFDYQEESNIMWLSSYDGIIAIYLDQLENNVYKSPKFIIEEVNTGANLYSYIFLLPKTINKRDIHIKTAFFNYQSQSSFFLRYKIDNSRWFYTSGSSLNISNLQYGNHSIILQASEYGYIWSDPVQYDFYVNPYWYERLWVRILALIFVISGIFFLIYFIVKTNNKKANKRIEFEKKVIDLKLQALNAAINSHFVFNVLNAIQYFVSSNQQLKASKFIADFAKFMRIIIDNSNLTIIPIREEVRRIHLYIGLEIMRFEDRLDYAIHVDPSIDQDEIMLPNMIIQPFVENSILHGILSSKNKGTITIDILDEGEFIHIRIKDNGIGINAARMKKKVFNKKSIGLRNVLQRLELFSGSKGYNYALIDLSTMGETGTMVDIQFPKLTLSDLT